MMAALEKALIMYTIDGAMPSMEVYGLNANVRSKCLLPFNQPEFGSQPKTAEAELLILI